MSVKRPIEQFSGDDYFAHGLPIYVNRAVESFEVMEHRHDFLEIACVSEGAGTHYAEGRSFPVAAGDIFLLPVGVSHVFRPSTPNVGWKLIVYNCLVSFEAVSELVAAFPGGSEFSDVLRANTFRRFRDRTGEFDELFRDLYAEFSSARPARKAALHVGVLRLLLALYRCEADEQLPPVVAATGMDAALAALNGSLEQPPAVSDLARLAGVGTRQFHRLFVQRTGMTPTDYAQSVRIREACRLLAATDRKVADIAASVGYRNVPFFNALFRRKTGLSPREYKKKARTATQPAP